MNKSGDLNSPLGQLISVPKKTAEQLVKEPLEVVEEAGVQTRAKPSPSATSPQGNKSGATLDKNTEEFVKEGLYGKSDASQNNTSNNIQLKVRGLSGQPEFMKRIANLSPEEQKKKLEFHLERHKEVYANEIINPSLALKKSPQLRAGEEVAKEQEEKEKKQMEELQLQEQKKKEVSSPFVKQGTVERNPGASG